MSEAARVASAAQPAVQPRVNVNAIAIGGLALGASVYFSVCSLLIHWSFHSYGWDLGIFDQVMWSIAHGHGFHYSFRDMWYLGDHFQPMLVFLAPLVFLKLGPSPILVVQGLAFGAAVIPLHAAVRRLAGTTWAWALAIAYVVSLGPARAVSYDFHPECFVPALTFLALWGLAAKRPVVFAAATISLLPIKEDVAFLALGLCWVAWLGFGERKVAGLVAIVAITYFLSVSLVALPQISHGRSNPLVERYPYLGDTPRSIFFHALTRPDLIIDHVWNNDTLRTLLYLFAGTGFLALLRPKFLLPMLILLLPPLLAVSAQQQRLELHYGVVPYTFTFVLAAMAVQTEYREKLLAFVPRLKLETTAFLGVGVAAVAVAMFVWKSPLPPSFSTHLDQFDVDHHSEVAQSFVDAIPSDVVVSAQASFVPHLSERHDIFEFPIVGRATYVLIDDKRYVPGYDQPAFNGCRLKLPSFGFAMTRSEDGIELWQRSDDDAARLGSDGCG
jgi:uncharacterized membrane protein